MLPVQTYLKPLNSRGLIYLLVVLIFFSGTILGYVSIYVMYLYNHVLYPGQQCFSIMQRP